MDNDEVNKQYELIFSNDDYINIDLSDLTSLSTVTVSAIGQTDQVLTSDGWQWISNNKQEVVFEDTMPNPLIVNEMCKEYPALDKAYENFKTIYKMVKQDWDGKQKDSES